MKRRDFMALGIKAGGVGMIAATQSACEPKRSPSKASYAKQTHRSERTWSNWSENMVCHPKQVVSPQNESQLIDLFKNNTKLRIVGSGHSFMPLVTTDAVMVSLDQFAGLISSDAKQLTTTFKGATKISQINYELEQNQQAAFSLPDVSYQSLAGAISTGTHGSGRNFTALHGYVTDLKLVSPSGQVWQCNAKENAEIFLASKVALGALGAITEITLQNRPPYNLHRQVYFEYQTDFLKNGEQLFEKHEHFELFFLPHTGFCLLIVHDEHQGPLRPRIQSPDDDGLQDLILLRNYLSWSPRLRELATSLIIKPKQIHEDAIDQSWRLLSQPRITKLNEMEYHIPKANGFACYQKVCETIDQMPQTFAPVEFRLVKGDDAWLSPFYQQDSYSIAIHAHYEEPYEYFFSVFEPIFRHYGGRPHWGKLNSLGKDDFAKLYPKWSDFLAIRAELDPKGVLLNDYLQKIFMG